MTIHRALLRHHHDSLRLISQSGPENPSGNEFGLAIWHSFRECFSATAKIWSWHSFRVLAFIDGIWSCHTRPNVCHRRKSFPEAMPYGKTLKQCHIEDPEAMARPNSINDFAIKEFAIKEPPAPMNHVKIFKGWPPRDAPSKLVQLWYKTFPPDQRGLVEIKKPN